MTLAERLKLADDRPSGFDYMRQSLSVLVVCFHTVVVTFGEAAQGAVWQSEWRVLVGPIVPAFFAFSGFLVAGSIERSRTVCGFLYLRALRMFPALVVEILVSAFLLGPLMTKFSLAAYFQDHQLYDYLLNCLGLIHYRLPGLFLANPFSGWVNGQLWTAPYELDCYILFGVLAFLGVTRDKIFLLLVCLIQVAAVMVFVLHDQRLDSSPSGGQLIVFFLVGVLFYKFRSHIPCSRWLFLFSVAATVGLMSIYHGYYLVFFPLVYMTVYLGSMNPPRLRAIDSGDYSYGIYLYGFPIQQAVVATGLLPADPWINLLVSLPLVILVAVASWHLCEKRVLSLRKYRGRIDTLFAFSVPGGIVNMVLPRRFVAAVPYDAKTK